MTVAPLAVDGSAQMQDMQKLEASRAKLRPASLKGSAAPNTRNPGGSRERLMDAAERLVTRLGANHFTLDAVSQESGISKGGLLYHFHSKTALLSAIVDRYCESFACRMQPVLAEDRPSLTAFLHAYMDARLGCVDGRPQKLSAALLAASATEPGLLTRVRDQRAEVLKFMGGLEGDQQVALVVIYALDGLMLNELLQLDSLDGEQCAQLLDALQGIAKATSGEGCATTLQVRQL